MRSTFAGEEFAQSHEEQLRRSAELLRFLIDRSPFGFYIVDADFRIAHINAESQSRAFRNVAPAVGRRLDEAVRVLWPEPLATEIIGIFRHTLDTGEPYKSPGLVGPRHDLEEVEAYEWQLERITMPNGTYGVVCYYYDTTLLRQAERRLHESDRRKDEFLAMLAHELRNPLAAIRNAVEILLQSDGEPQTVRSASEILERQVRHMARQVDDLLDVSRISRGIIELRKEPTDLASVVSHAREAVGPLLESLDQQLVVNLPAEPLRLDADPVRLAQVVANLLSNACKFTDPGGHIQLTVERSGDRSERAVLRVRDSGIGIAEDQLSRIFETFAQVDSSLERAQGGLGLGLTLVKKVVELHGGTVEAVSGGLGQGSEFIVWLPLPASPPSPRPISSAAQPSATLPRRILVVDDNRDSAQSLAMLLRLGGHEVEAVYDGVEAVARAATYRPDVILLDIGMPGLNGYEAAKRIRQQCAEKNVRLIAVTGWAQHEDRQRSAEAGFDAHLVKPVDLVELTRLLAEWNGA